MNNKKIRWISVVLPFLFVVIIDVIRHQLNPMPVESATVRFFYYFFTFIGIFIFSRFLLNVIEKLFRKIQFQNQQLTILNRVNSELNKSLAMKEELQNSLEWIVSYADMDYGEISLIHAETNDYFLEVSYGKNVHEKTFTTEIPITSNSKLIGKLKLVSLTFKNLEDHMPILTNIGQQLGVHIENSHLYQQAQFTSEYLNSVIESSEDAIIICEFDGIIRSWSKGAEKIYGYSKEEAVGSFLPMVPREMQKEALAVIKKIRQGETRESWETKRLTRSGERKDINVTVSPLQDQNGKITAIMGVSKDITHKKKMEQIIIKRNKDLNLLNKLAFQLNRSFDNQKSFEESLLQIKEYLHLKEISLHENLSEDEFYTIPSISTETSREIIPLKSKEKIVGFLNILQDENQPLDTESRKVLINFAHYVSVTLENKRLTLKVQNLAVLEERERISMDLHDGVIQSLYGMGLKMEGLLDEGNIEVIKQDINKYIDQLNAINKDIRTYIFNLKRNFNNHRFSVFLYEWIDSLKNNYSIDIQTSIETDFNQYLTETQLNHIVHITKEALTNIIKHSEATHIKVDLKKKDTHAILSISDNGVGFIQTKTDEDKGQGLKNMAKRAKEIKGELTIDSQSGKGTAIKLSVPVASIH